jgi:hypothetical protein
VKLNMYECNSYICKGKVYFVLENNPPLVCPYCDSGVVDEPVHQIEVKHV